MAIVPIFTGRITEDGQLQLARAEAELRRQHLRSLAGREIEVVVRRKREQRTIDMNKYWHGVPFKILADYWGEDIETTKLLVLGECFGWRDYADGRRIPLKPSTSALTVEEGSYLTDWIPPWAMTRFGLDIPLPEKATAA